MPGTLYGNSENARTQKVLASAKYGGAAVTASNNPPPQDKFPFGQTPAYEDRNTLLSGSAAISWQLGGEKLRGQTKDLVPQVIQWLQTSDSTFSPVALSVVLPSLSLAPQDKRTFDLAKSSLESLLSTLDAYLLTRTFLVGERISHADIHIALDLLPAFQHVLEPSVREANKNVTRWFLTIVNQPEVKSVLGEVTLCKKAATFDGKKFKENQSLLGLGASESKSDAKPKEDKKKDKKEEKKKEEKKKEEKKEKEPEEEPDEAELAQAAEPKQADPFAGVPKGTFNLDEFKRTYSNEDTITKALPYFWEKFDPEAYSIWYCEYKFPQELTLVFMSCNLIGGMFQRLEKLKKSAFASVCLFGENNNSTISGVWIWRGQELVFPLSPDWQVDYESYDWKKLDFNDAKTKTLVNEYFAWEGNFDGKTFNQGKILK